MTESNQHEIINRLHKLENQNRYMKLGGLAIVLLVVTTLLTGASKKPDVAEEIRAKKIVLVNEQGKEVIVMENINNVSRIIISDSKGKTLFVLGATDGSSILGMLDSNGNNRLSLIADDEGSRFDLWDIKGKKLLALGATDGSSMLCMWDSKEILRLALGSSDAEDNGGILQIYNKTNESIVQLHADEYGNGKVGAYNRKGEGRTLTPGP